MPVKARLRSPPGESQLSAGTKGKDALHVSVAEPEVSIRRRLEP